MATDFKKDLAVIERRRANPEGMKLYDYGQKAWNAAPKQNQWRAMVDEALATERRLVVERIRMEVIRLANMGQHMDTVLPILDAEDER